MLKADYTDLTVLSIAADGKDMSFSSDTGMAECLVIARKTKASVPPGERARFASLRRRPAGLAPAGAVAASIENGAYVRQIEEGPYGGTRLTVGDELSGEILNAPAGAGGEAWGSVRLSDYSLAQTAYALADSRLWLQAIPQPRSVENCGFGVIGNLGLVDRDITGPPPRGPFMQIPSSLTATYPALWNHNAKKRNANNMRPGFTIGSKAGNGSQSGNSMGNCQPSPYQ